MRQFVILPTGAGGINGQYSRNGASLNYEVFNVPKTPVQELLDGPFPTLAFWAVPDPMQLIDEVVKRIAAIPDFEAQVAVAELGMLITDKGVASRYSLTLRSTGMNRILEGTEAGDLLTEDGRSRERAAILKAMIDGKFGPGSATQELLDAMGKLPKERLAVVYNHSATLDELTSQL